MLDGEIVCLDENGHAQFNELLFRRGTPRFCAFDLLSLNDRDLRELPLIERKRSFRRLIPPGCDRVLYVDQIEGGGETLFELVCERDLEGVVDKRLLSRYTTENHNPAWVKICNRRYSQMIGRDELFERVGCTYSIMPHNTAERLPPMHSHAASGAAVLLPWTCYLQPLQRATAFWWLNPSIFAPYTASQ